MTILKRRRCRWKDLAGSITLAAGALPATCATAQAVVAEPGAVQAEAPRQAEEVMGDGDYYLEVTLNHMDTRQIAHFSVRNGRLYARAGTLEEVGLPPPDGADPDEFLPLNSFPGLDTQYDAAAQRLRIDAPLEAFRGRVTRLGYQPPPPPRLDPATRAPGLLLNYDAYGEKFSAYRNLSGWTELRMFSVGPGVWQTSQVMQSTDAYGATRFRNTRLDSNWELDFPDSMVTVALGDSITGALNWTRSMRMGGLRISRNFNLQPYRVTVPLASFAGQTALPSSVDLIINGVREPPTRAPPGEFQLLSAPIVNGAGTAQMVITDVTGRRRVVNFAFYNSARMLQKGLADWSFETGALRTHYGIKSFSYQGSPMFSGSARYGATNILTLEAHGENSKGLTMGGVGALLQLGSRGGIVSTSVASSSHHGRRGQQYGLGYELQNRGVNINLAALRRDDDFRDIGTLVDATLPLRTYQAFLGVPVGSGQLGASYVRQSYRDDATASYAGLSWSQPLGRYGHLGVGVNRDISGKGGTNGYVYWSLPLGQRDQLWASAERDRSRNSGRVGYTRTLPGDRDGWGWRLEAGAGEESGGAAEISQLTRYGQWRAGAQTWNEHDYGRTRSVNAEAVGGLLLMDGSLIPMRRAYDAFALVSTDGIADVPVKLENRFVGNTDKKGQLLVTPLNAWENNDLSIDPENLPADVQVERFRVKAVPATHSGMLVRFPMREIVMVELALRLPDGAWVPAGSDAVVLPADTQTVVGYDGRMYLESPRVGSEIRVTLEDGECSVTLPDRLPAHGRLNLGELVCR